MVRHRSQFPHEETNRDRRRTPRCPPAPGRNRPAIGRRGGRPAGPLTGQRFQSAEPHERGLGPRGPVLGYWSLAFANGRFTWEHSDVVRGGAYTVAAATGQVSVNGEVRPLKDYRYDRKTGALTWQGEEYREAPKDK